MTRSARYACVSAAALVAALSLGACNRAPPSAATAAPPDGALAPVSASVALAPAPDADALPPASPPPIRRAADRRSAYAFAERAAELGDAFADAPPDYTYDYGGGRPWVWRTHDRYERVVEQAPDGQRVYYYEPGADEPFYVQDPDYGYGFASGALVVIYDRDGREEAPDVRRAQWAGRYLARARNLFWASQQQPHVAVSQHAWATGRDEIDARRRRWTEAQQVEPDWRAYHDQYGAEEQAHWRDERLQRLAWAAQVDQSMNDQEHARRVWAEAQAEARNEGRPPPRSYFGGPHGREGEMTSGGGYSEAPQGPASGLRSTGFGPGGPAGFRSQTPAAAPNPAATQPASGQVTLPPDVAARIAQQQAAAQQRASQEMAARAGRQQAAAQAAAAQAAQDMAARSAQTQASAQAAAQAGAAHELAVRQAQARAAAQAQADAQARAVQEQQAAAGRAAQERQAMMARTAQQQVAAQAAAQARAAQEMAARNAQAQAAAQAQATQARAAQEQAAAQRAVQERQAMMTRAAQEQATAQAATQARASQEMAARQAQAQAAAAQAQAAAQAAQARAAQEQAARQAQAQAAAQDGARNAAARAQTAQKGHPEKKPNANDAQQRQNQQ